MNKKIWQSLSGVVTIEETKNNRLFAVSMTNRKESDFYEVKEYLTKDELVDLSKSIQKYFKESEKT